jgi:hypothetical protein
LSARKRKQREKSAVLCVCVWGGGGSVASPAEKTSAFRESRASPSLLGPESSGWGRGEKRRVRENILAFQGTRNTDDLTPGGEHVLGSRTRLGQRSEGEERGARKCSYRVAQSLGKRAENPEPLTLCVERCGLMAVEESRWGGVGGGWGVEAAIVPRSAINVGLSLAISKQFRARLLQRSFY